MLKKIIELTNKYEEETIRLRRMIHQNPELSGKEYDTSKLVEEELFKLGLEAKKIGETGILCVLNGEGILNKEQKYKTLMLRADMDALPIEEDLDLEFKSKNIGIMHACGHDVHTANLITVAKILNELKDKWSGTIKFLFQPAEEKGAGAMDMIRNGVLKSPDVDFAMALHIMPIEKGKVLINHGNITAYSGGFIIRVKGKSAHSRKPQEGIDAINIAGHIIVSLNSILSKDISPLSRATFSIGQIIGGKASNIIADDVELKGMIRSLDKDAQEIIKTKTEEISKGIAKTFGGNCEFVFHEGYPSVFNDESTTKLLGNLFRENFLDIIEDIDKRVYNKNSPDKYILKDAQPIMASEDFGFYSEQLPSIYYMVGTGDYAPGHSSTFYVDEKWIKFCTRTMLIGALKILNIQ